MSTDVFGGCGVKEYPLDSWKGSRESADDRFAKYVRITALCDRAHLPRLFGCNVKSH